MIENLMHAQSIRFYQFIFNRIEMLLRFLGLLIDSVHQTGNWLNNL